VEELDETLDHKELEDEDSFDPVRNLKRNAEIMRKELSSLKESWQKNELTFFEKSSLHQHATYIKDSAKVALRYYKDNVWGQVIVSSFSSVI
jgi:hypothetical protein